MRFKLKSDFKPTGDQPKAIAELIHNYQNGVKSQVLLGVTGSGKTYTVANLIEKIQKPTLIISHNKTLAAQLYSEFKAFFPKNAVKYFVSYYDYYQPEAYLPQTDTYIEKDSQVNQEIDRLRNEATFSLMTRKDVIVIASVSAIYGLGNPKDYEKMHLEISLGQNMTPRELAKALIALRYNRNDFTLERVHFSLNGDVLDLFPSYGEKAIRIEIFDNKVERISEINPFTKKMENVLEQIVVYPATQFVNAASDLEAILGRIKADMEKQEKVFLKQQKFIEAQRIRERTLQDIEMIRELGYCTGIENYSFYFDGRKSGEAPACLLDYYPKDFLLVVDESHMTIPQIRGMYFGDRSRKETLVNFGFRLPTAMDNRPLKFDEFLQHLNREVYISATPDKWELTLVLKQEDQELTELDVAQKSLAKIVQSPLVVEQVIRPTFLLDPQVEVRSTKNQLENLMKEIKKRTKSGQRTLVTVLTKRMAEELSEYLREKGLKVAYLHSEIETLKRPKILRELREGVYDILVGVNLLREGLDLPEVSLVAIIDADKEGFLRSSWALIQTMGRAARHQDGKVILYADKMTGSMKKAINETNRRRKIQEAYNQKFHKKPLSINKPIKTLLEIESVEPEEKELLAIDNISQDEKEHLIQELNSKMELAASNLEFERAAFLRDQIDKLQKNKE
ncbi:MAG: excinuclease ABC subunit UvrB [Patescibacteria group bacterium]|nr:excinuclease ABC subunit UvrB [Patescibacteria group bacterium]